jgi:hypothetical protein
VQLASSSFYEGTQNAAARQKLNRETSETEEEAKANKSRCGRESGHSESELDCGSAFLI